MSDNQLDWIHNSIKSDGLVKVLTKRKRELKFKWISNAIPNGDKNIERLVNTNISHWDQRLASDNFQSNSYCCSALEHFQVHYLTSNYCWCHWWVEIVVFWDIWQWVPVIRSGCLFFEAIPTVNFRNYCPLMNYWLVGLDCCQTMMNQEILSRLMW